MKVKITRGQTSNKNTKILSGLYLAYSLKEYKIIWYKCLHHGVEYRTQNPGQPLKGQGHDLGSAQNQISERNVYMHGGILI